MDIDYFDGFNKDILEGLNSEILPMGFERLASHVGLRKSTYYLIGGFTGSGKTSLVDDAFVLNPYDFLVSNKGKTNIKLKIFYFSMERKRSFKIAKWISRKIFLEQGDPILSVGKIMGWVSKQYKLTNNEHDLIILYKDYINELFNNVITMVDAPINPMGIKKLIDEYALANGRIETIDAHNRIYIPNNPNEIVMIIYDTAGLMKRESRTRDGEKVRFNSKKEIIDQASEDARKFRDFYGYSPVFISQFNRSIANPLRIKNGDVEPQLDDFKESGNTAEDADVVWTLFDPYRYNVPDPSGYDLTKLRDANGAKKFRSLRVIKNSFGSDDLRVGLAFQPIIGHFAEMPKLVDTTEETYNSIIGNNYFLLPKN